jgi:hypothetical protein
LGLGRILESRAGKRSLALQVGVNLFEFSRVDGLGNQAAPDLT